MGRLDERIRSGLREVAGAAAPDVSALTDEVRRRRTRRGRARKLQVAALALVVIAGTVGTYAVLDRIFTPSPTTIDQPITHENGPLVSVERRFNGDSYLVLDPLDGTQARAITPSVGEQAWDPAASPDGNLVAYVAVTMGGGVDDDFEPELRLVDIRTGQVVVLATGILFDPSWSPDGDWIAVERITVDQGGIAVIEVATHEWRYLTDEGGDPAWSPDGTTIAYEVPTDRPPQRFEPEGIFAVPVSGGDPRSLSTFGSSPSWSPDGSTIAFADQGAGIWTMTQDGADKKLIAGQVQASPGGSEPSFANPGWSPDGSRLTYVVEGAELWIVSDALDGTQPERLTKGVDYAWLPRANPPIDAEAEAMPSPPGSEGQDIGLDFRVCFEVGSPPAGERVEGLLVEGSTSTVWLGQPVKETGNCADWWLVAVDLTGDGEADAWNGPFLVTCKYVGCYVMDTADLDADGDRELIVHTGFSIIDHVYFSVSEPSPGGFVIEPILVAEPGNPAASISPGEPLVTSAAGDEGYASWMRCEGFPGSPVLVWTWTWGPIDASEGDREWHETEIQLQADGMFHVIASNDFSLPVGADPGLLRSEDPACGVDFNIWAPPNP